MKFHSQNRIFSLLRRALRDGSTLRRGRVIFIVSSIIFARNMILVRVRRPAKSGMRVRRPVEPDCNLSPFWTAVTRDRRSASEWNASAQILNRTRCCGASSIVAPDHQETLLGIRGLTFVRDTGNGSMHERHHLRFVPSRQERYDATLWYRISWWKWLIVGERKLGWKLIIDVKILD